MIRIFPSLMAANPLDLASLVTHLAPHCDGFHLDMMDNHFVPHLLGGPQLANALTALTRKPLFVHLMVDDPNSLIEELHLPAESIISFHIERCVNILTTMKKIRVLKMHPSIAIAPKTPLADVLQWAECVDQVLVMSVEPGASGQALLSGSHERIAEVARYREDRGLNFRIAVDGGVNTHTIRDVVDAGAQDLVCGHAIFSADDPVQALKQLYALATN